MLCSVLEINFHLLGSVCVLAATTLRSLKSIMQGELLSDPADKLDAVSLLFYMAPHAGAMLIIVSLLTEGLHPFTIFFEGSPTGILNVVTLLALGGTNACLLNIANFLVTSYTSPVTLQVLGNVKSCISIVISVLIFHNQLRFMQGLGVAICLFGVHVYERKGGKIDTSSLGSKPSVADKECGADRELGLGAKSETESENTPMAPHNPHPTPQQVPPPLDEDSSDPGNVR